MNEPANQEAMEMPHLTTGARPVNINAFIDRHYGPVSDESRRRLRETLESSNRAKVVDGTIRLPAIIVTPDDPEVPETERRACESMARGAACRFQARMRPREVGTLGKVMDSFGSAGVSALSVVGAFAARHREDLLVGNSWVSGGNYGVTRRLGGFADALRAYETTLNNYILNYHSPAARQMQHRDAAVRAFKSLQGRFGAEMQMLARSPRYASWLYNPFERFVGGIESSFRTNGSPIDALPETRLLQRTLRATRFLGRGLLAVDLVGRAATVATSDNRSYASAREGVSFLTAAGGATLAYGGTLLALSVLGVPGGVVVLIGLGIGSAVGAVAGDTFGREIFDWIAEPILEWVAG